MQRRNTKHKEDIKTLFRNAHLLSAADIAKELPDTDYSTIYRNLKRFVNDGELKEVMIDGIQFFERADMSEHFHFKCEDCESVEEMHVSADIIAQYAPQGSKVGDIELMVRGTCAQCRT